MLDRPEIPLHTNGSENASFVTKRRISGETRSAAGKQARDTFLSLLKTCSKLAISFWTTWGPGSKSRMPTVYPGSPISSGRTFRHRPAQTAVTAYLPAKLTKSAG